MDPGVLRVARPQSVSSVTPPPPASNPQDLGKKREQSGELLKRNTTSGSVVRLKAAHYHTGF